MPHRRPAPLAGRPLARRLPLVAPLLLLLAGALGAQRPAPGPPAVPPAVPPVAPPGVSREPSSDAAECLGFAFGRWTPALDARAAGHPALAGGALPQAPNGRDWAAAIEAGRDTTLMLFPAWWPAGVHVRLPGRRAAARDTVRATATALVADGRVRAPSAIVLVWAVRCD